MNWPDWWPPDRHNSAVINTAIALLFFSLGLMIGNASARGAFKIGDWQTLISAGIAVIAMTVAWVIGIRTLRFNLMKHEEERLLTAIPGLLAVKDFITPINIFIRSLQSPEQNARRAVRLFIPENKLPLAAIEEKVKGKADSQLIREVSAIMARLVHTADVLGNIYGEQQKHRMQPPPSDKIGATERWNEYRAIASALEVAQKNWQEARAALEDFTSDLDDRHQRAQRRLVYIRAWVDRFFDS